MSRWGYICVCVMFESGEKGINSNFKKFNYLVNSTVLILETVRKKSKSSNNQIKNLTVNKG